MTLKVQACNHSITLVKINQKTIIDSRCEKQTVCPDGRNIQVLFSKGVDTGKSVELQPFLQLIYHTYYVAGIARDEALQILLPLIILRTQIGRILILKMKKLSPREEVKQHDQSPTANQLQRWDPTFPDSRPSALRSYDSSLVFTATIFIPKAIIHLPRMAPISIPLQKRHQKLFHRWQR